MSGAREVAQIGEHLVGVCVDVADLVTLRDHALGIDEVAEPLREVDLLGARIPRLVGDPDLLVDVGEQPEREVELVAEGAVGVGGVERDPEDDAPEGLELVGLVTQALAFDRSAGGVGHRIPPQQHPAPAQVGEAYRVAVVVDDTAELGRSDSGRQHRGAVYARTSGDR